MEISDLATHFAGSLGGDMGLETANPLPADADPALHELYRRWAGFASKGHLPSANDLAFDELVTEFPGAALIEVVPRNDSSMRYSYAKTDPDHRKAVGRDIEGYSIDELVAPQQIEHFEGIYDRIVESGQPHYWMRVNSLVGSRIHTFERLLVPVADDGKTVNALIGVWVWVDL